MVFQERMDKSDITTAGENIMKIVVIAAVLGCMSGGAYSAGFNELAVKSADLKALAATEGLSVPAVPRGSDRGNDVKANVPSRPVEWVSISGGKFRMGTDSGETGFEDAVPVREVSIQTFSMSKTAVTVEQYAECVSQGACTEPGSADQGCNWGKPGKQLHPVNCVYFSQATEYARFMGARLPSESEWEYAATSGGRNINYPWGNTPPTRYNAVMRFDVGYGSTMPVCSKPAGNTAQGLCDMAGNVCQWVQDTYQDSYNGAPLDGRAYEGYDGSVRVMRGGSFFNDEFRDLRSGHRGSLDTGYRRSTLGFRLAR